MAFGDGALDHFDRKVAGMLAIVQNLAGHAEAYMKENAPWRDLTSNARNGLNAGVIVGRDKWRLYLAHGVDYGTYLELAHGGNYAIVRPTAAIYRGKLREAMLDWWR